MTETSTAIAMTPATQQAGLSGSAGTLLPGCRARVVKEDGSLAKAGERGELVVYSPSNAIGYYNNPEA
jgi:4-coumarate--CoA ligase